MKLEEIINQYTNYLYTTINNIAYGNLSNEDVEEVISDTFFIFWKNKEKFDVNKKINLYLAGIAKNLIKEKFRKIHINNNIEDYENILIDTYDISNSYEQIERKTITYEDYYNLEFDVSEQLINRKSIEYISSNSSIESAILTNSGFVITVKDSNYISRNANYIVKDAEGNSYTLSNTERILKKTELTEIEKQVLIFNITKYNESDSITLIKNDVNIIEFIKK